MRVTAPLIFQTPIGHPQQSASSSQNQSRLRKKKVSNEEEVALIGNLIETISNFRAMYQTFDKDIDKLQIISNALQIIKN